MTMTEDKKVNFLLFDLCIGKLRKPFFFRPEEVVGHVAGVPAFLRPKARDPFGQIGMDQMAIEPLVDPAVKYFFYEFVSMISRPQTITMVDKESLSIILTHDRLAINRDSKLRFEVPEHPHIVIAGKEIDLNSLVSQLR